MGRRKLSIDCGQSGPRSSGGRPDGYGRAFRRHRWMIVACIIVCALGGFFLSYRQLPLYLSQSKLVFTKYSQPSDPATTVSVADEAFLRQRADMIQSAEVLDLASSNLLARHLRSLGSSENIAKNLQLNLTATVNKNDGTITVACVSPVATDSAIIVNAVVDAFENSELQHRQSVAIEQLRPLQVEKNNLDAAVSLAAGRVVAFKKQNPDFALPDNHAIDQANQRLAKLGEQLTDAQSNTASLQSRCNLMSARLSAEAAPVVGAAATDDDDTDVAWVQDEMNRAAANLDALTAKGLPPTDTSVQDERAYLARLHQKLAICQRNAAYLELAKLKQEVVLAQLHQAQVDSWLNAQKKVVTEVTAKGTEFAGLQDELARAQRASDELSTKISQISVAQEIPFDIRVIDQARPASAPIRSWRRLTAWGAVVGLVAGMGLSLLSHYTDGRLRSPAQVSSWLGLPVLGIVHHQTQQNRNIPLGLVSHIDPMSDIAEAARSVRTALFSATRSTPVKTVLITSANQGDGKSLFATNLAIAMAQAGSRTLLIDAGFSEQRIQDVFDIRKPAGLSHVLAGFMTPENAICRTPVERLELMPGGVIPPDSAGLLNGPLFSSMVEKVCSKYQSVIIDSPAVLHSSDARILGASADITLYVVRSGSTHRKAADHGLDQLLSVGSRVLGVVVNDVDLCYATARTRGMIHGLNTASPDQHIELSARAKRAPVENLHRRRAIAGLETKKMETGVVPEIDVLD